MVVVGGGVLVIVYECMTVHSLSTCLYQPLFSKDPSGSLRQPVYRGLFGHPGEQTNKQTNISAGVTVHEDVDIREDAQRNAIRKGTHTTVRE